MLREPITYILTDRVREFCDICDNLGLRRYGSKLLAGQNTVWIERWDQILGRRIYPEDQLVWGYYADMEQAHRIRVEIAIRTKIED